ncbi:MAG: ATPase, partial [Planctomycetota bacterium]
MYENYWNLSRKPFDDDPDRGWYYPAEGHQGALLKLRYAIENQRGASILAGRGGVGKTLIINQLLATLPEHITPRAHIVFPQMPADQLLAFL